MSTQHKVEGGFNAQVFLREIRARADLFAVRPSAMPGVVSVSLASDPRQEVLVYDDQEDAMLRRGGLFTAPDKLLATIGQVLHRQIVEAHLYDEMPLLDIVRKLRRATDDERVEFLADLKREFCNVCGRITDGRTCHCWNDD